MTFSQWKKSNILAFSIHNIFLEISVINHEKVKKTKGLNAESYLAFSEKPKNKRYLRFSNLVY